MVNAPTADRYYQDQASRAPNGQPYVGRFAPSPTGPLHMGSLVTALASYLDARAHQGQWLLRIEDLDPPREQPDAKQRIIDSLEQHGLTWDGELRFQSQRSEYYQAALDKLIAEQKAFACQCSRSQQAESGGLHHGRCKADQTNTPVAYRLLVPELRIDFIDRLLGPQHALLASQAGDFVLRRKDALWAYQLAVVVDDAEQGVTHIVRGADLLDSTARQIYLQQCLGYPTPHYCHTPLLVHNNGQKLSKQNLSPAVDNQQAVSNLRQALNLLQQPTPPTALNMPAMILDWAVERWQLDQLGTNAINIDAHRW